MQAPKASCKQALSNDRIDLEQSEIGDTAMRAMIDDEFLSKDFSDKSDAEFWKLAIKTTRFRNIMIEALERRVVKPVASRFRGRHVGIPHEEIEQACRIGLDKALLEYKPGKIKLLPYLYGRTKDRCYDVLRRDYLKKGRNKKLIRYREAEKLVEGTLGPSDRHEDAVLKAAGMTKKDRHELKALAAIDPYFYGSGPHKPTSDVREDELFRAQNDSSVTKFEREEANKVLTEQLLQNLSKRERFVIEESYVKGRTLRDIGAELDLTESRIVQIRKVALDRLKNFVSSSTRTQETIVEGVEFKTSLDEKGIERRIMERKSLHRQSRSRRVRRPSKLQIRR